MNFIAPFSFPVFIDRGSTPAFCDFCCSYLERGREDEFYSLWLCCPPEGLCSSIYRVIFCHTPSLVT